MTRFGLASILALAACAAVYLSGLTYSPVYLLNDEVFSALQAVSLATTGRSLAGDFLPVFFRGLEFSPGRDPVYIYATALTLKVLPISELALRLPTAIVGLSCIALVDMTAWELWRRRDAALLAAAMFAVTPAHFINSRIGIPTMWAIPCVLAWTIGLLRYADGRQLRILFWSMAALGSAVLSYFGTAVIVPLYVAGTLVWLRFALGERTLRPYLVALAGLALPLLFLAYWQLVHPERWRELAHYYFVDQETSRTGTSLFAAGARWPNFAAIQERVTTYWNHFDPSFLFLGGDHSPRYSTGRSGVFPLAAAVLLPIGIYRAAHESRSGRLLVYCLLCTPLVASLSGQVQIQRTLPLVVFGSLLTTWGLLSLLGHQTRGIRRAGVILLLTIALQAVVFTYDYFGHYRLRSGESRGGNLRGAFTEVVAAAPERARPVLYLSNTIPNVSVYWRFYQLAMDARGLVPRTELVNPGDLAAAQAPAGALLIALAEEPLGDPAGANGSWRLRRRIYELDGPTFYSVYEKVE